MGFVTKCRVPLFFMFYLLEYRAVLSSLEDLPYPIENVSGSHFSSSGLHKRGRKWRKTYKVYSDGIRGQQGQNKPHVDIQPFLGLPGQISYIYYRWLFIDLQFWRFLLLQTVYSRVHLPAFLHWIWVLTFSLLTWSILCLSLWAVPSFFRPLFYEDFDLDDSLSNGKVPVNAGLIQKIKKLH